VPAPDDIKTPTNQPVLTAKPASNTVTKNEGDDYSPSNDVAPRQRLDQRPSTTSRTAFSARTMSAITSETGRMRGRRVPTNLLVTKILLLMDVLVLAGLAVAIQALPTFFPSSWQAPVEGLIPLGVLLVTTLTLIDAYRIDVREQVWRHHAHLVRALVVATALGLSAAFAIGWWRPETAQAFFTDGQVVLAADFSLLAVLNRTLLRRWMNLAAGQASWLMVAKRDTDGLEQFWADFGDDRAHGRMMFLSDEPGSQIYKRGEVTGNRLSKPPVGGQWHDLRTQLAKGWTGIIVADASQLDAETVRAVMAARLSGTPVLSLEEFYERYWHRVPVFLLRSEWFALSSGFQILRSPVQTHLKRVCDVLLAGGLLILASPFMVLIAAWVKFDSPGPILYRQDRTGLGGKIFTCLKFRSMVTNADKGSLYAGKNDNRVTRFGRFIRRARIDELPQLINVLRGDMSFIGPRAMWTKIVDGHDQEIPYFQLRHLVRPGLTGWAQVNYHYGGSAEDMRIKLEYDLWYIKNHSLVLDFLIVLRTVRVVLFGIGAQ